jgi:sugar lactone lactonase YvrE
MESRKPKQDHQPGEDGATAPPGGRRLAAGGRSRVVAVGTAVGIAAVLGLAGGVSAAAADTITSMYGTPGTYSLTIPAYTTSVHILASGAAGAYGGSNPISNGGAGGKGASLDATIPIGGSPGGLQNPFNPGDSLQIIVGSYGGGGAGGSGNEVGGAGGGGGGAAIVYDSSSFNFPLAGAGGGGGGGGGGGAFFGYDGGAGGSAPGGLGLNGNGAGAGAGATNRSSRCGTVVPLDPAVAYKGENAGGAGGGSDAGGGGGGGDGACGGWAGSPGVGGGGGGGGGTSGDSVIATVGTGSIARNPYDAAGVSITFTRTPVAPQITSTASYAVGLGAGSFHRAVTSQGFPDATYSISGAPSWIAIDPVTGVLGGIFPARTAGTFTFTVTASNGAAPAASQTFTLQVVGPPLAITSSATLPSATVGNAYSTTLLNTGGIGLEQWSLASGVLPAGLTLNLSGGISGTPTQAGTSRFTVRITDSQLPVAASVTKAVTLVVAPRVLAISSSALPAATAGRSYTKTLTASFGTAPYRFTIVGGSLPAGLQLSGNGTISGTPTTPGTSSLTFRVTDARNATATRTLSLTVSPVIQPAVFVLNGANSAINVFSPSSSSGNGSPLTTLSGAHTTLNGLGGVVIGPDGRVYVASFNTPSIAEFPYGARGDAAPDRTIQGEATGLVTVSGLTLDDAGRLYVANSAGNSVTVYAPGANGNAAPLTTLIGPHTGLGNPNAVAIDGHGHLWVANTSANTLTEYNANASGDTLPLATISGLDGPQAIAIDAAGNLLVANTYSSSILVYPVTASGNATPLRTIAGADTGLLFPEGVDIDSNGNIWVANAFANTVTEYAPTASGDAVPLTTIGGPLTGLRVPGPLAVAPPLSVATTKLSTARLHRRYRASLKANLGTTPYHWRLSKGRLPRGLRLNAQGRISGRALQRGTFHLTVRVTDATRRHPMTATQRLTLRVRR